jgi:hypothetical protein
VGQVAAQAERDAAILRAWMNGARQAELAERYGVNRSNISRAISRAAAQLPEPDRAAEILRTLDLVDDLVQAYAPRARAGNYAASREVRGLLALRGRFLGVDRRTVEHSGTVEHAHRYEPGPTVAEVLDEYRRQGALTVRGEITRP